jgi:hypothetical protein
MKLMPKLSLTTSPREYFIWQDAMENFFEGRGFNSVAKMYYAEETFAEDVLQWWLLVDDPCRTWEAMTCVLRRQFVYSQDAMQRALAPAAKRSLATKSIDSSKEIRKEDSQLLLKVEVPEPTIIHESDDSLASWVPSSASSSETQSKIEIDDTDDASDGLSMMARHVHSDGTAVTVPGQRSNIFQSECKIQEKVCKLIIDGGSFANVVSSELVNALSLSTWRLPTPHYIQWMNQSGTLKITHKARVKFSVGNYIDTVDCDIAPLSACHLLLGRPWQFDLDATHGGRSNCYSFVHKGIRHVLKPMLESAIKAVVFAPVKKKYDASKLTPKPRTALIQGEENGVAVPGRKTAAGYIETEYKVTNDTYIKVGSIAIILNEKNCGALSDVMSIKYSFVGCKFKVDHRKAAAVHKRNLLNTHSKPRTALFKGGKDDEPLVHQNILAGIPSGNNLKGPYFIKLGAFSFDVKKNMIKAGNIDFTATTSTSMILCGANLSQEKELCKFKKPPDIRS